MRLRTGVLALALTVSGCQSVVDGAAQPADHLGALTSTAASTAPTSSVKDMLLSTADIAQIVGETAMTEIFPYVEPVDNSGSVDPSDCARRALAGQDQTYGLEQWRQMSGTGLRGDGGHSVVQLVTVYANSSTPSGMTSYAAYRWKQCTQPLTLTTDTEVSHWTPGPVISDDRTRASTSMAKQGSPRVCQHVLAAKGTYTVETTVCGEDGQSGPQADEITAKILAKIPE